MTRPSSEQIDPPKGIITAATPIQIGIVFAFLSLVVGTVWGAATMNAKLDVVIAKIGSVETVNNGLRTDVNNLMIWKAEIDRSGSKQVDELRKSLEAFKTQFEIHIASTTKR